MGFLQYSMLGVYSRGNELRSALRNNNRLTCAVLGCAAASRARVVVEDEVVASWRRGVVPDKISSVLALPSLPPYWGLCPCAYMYRVYTPPVTGQRSVPACVWLCLCCLYDACVLFSTRHNIRIQVPSARRLSARTSPRAPGRN